MGVGVGVMVDGGLEEEVVGFVEVEDVELAVVELVIEWLVDGVTMIVESLVSVVNEMMMRSVREAVSVVVLVGVSEKGSWTLEEAAADAMTHVPSESVVTASFEEMETPIAALSRRRMVLVEDCELEM